MRKSLLFLLLMLSAPSFAMAAQALGSKTGNPTPGTPQPDPPNLADRVAVTGCIESVPQAAGQKDDPGEPSDNRFVLSDAARKTSLPPGTGTSSLAAAPLPQSLRLRGIASQLMPFVGARVELSGEILPRTGNESDRPPILQVEFVQKTGEGGKCQ